MMHVLVGAVSSKPMPISAEELLSLATTPALFGGQTFVFAGALTGESGEEVLEILDVLKKSSHTFVFEEEKLLKKETDALAKAGVKVETVRQAKKERRFDQFGVAEALGKRDKKKLWLALMASFTAGEKGEAVGGLMAWKARQMQDAQLSRELTFMYHDSHRGAGDLELLLERFALRL